MLRIIGKRLIFGALAAWAVLTTVFLAFTISSDWVANRIEGQIRWEMGWGAAEPWAIEGAVQSALDEYAAGRGLDRPLYEQYFDFMGNMLLLDWGESWDTNAEVAPMIWDATVRTAMYVVPAVVIAVIVGMLLGLYVALKPDSRVANSGRYMAYVLFGIPSFWVGGMLVGANRSGIILRNPVIFDHVAPIALVTATLVGGYVSYARAHTLEHASADFVKLIKAKGASPVQVARHVVRNAAIPLFSMLFTEVLGLLVLAIFVIEIVFGIEGFGLLLIEAIRVRDIPVLMGGMLVIIAVGIVGNIIQDVSYHYLDPRVDDAG